MELFDQIAGLFADFFDPKKRVFLGYLGLSLLIALVWMVFANRKSFSGAFAKVLDRRVFFSRSSIADYKIFVINQIIATLISPLLITQLAIATTIYLSLHSQDVLRAGLLSDLPTALVVGLFSVAMFTVDDLTKYLLHRWMHRYPLLWAIHKVHHSATTLTPITVYRVHPLEGILFGVRSAVAQGVTLPLFLFLFGSSVDLYTVVGVNILVFAFHVTGSNLRHSHVDIRYWPWLERILISPAQHQLHHSVAEKHYDKNFGAALAIWDWMFGSLHLSEKGETLTFGLDAGDQDYEADLKTLYFRPLIEMGRVIRSRTRRVVKYSSGLMTKGRATPPASTEAIQESEGA